MESDTRELGYFHLLQPELLDEHALKQILELRCIKLQNLGSMKKEKLVEIFHRVAVPLPQRKYKDNRRGKLLTRMRRKQENSKRRVQPEEKSNVTYGFSGSSPSVSSLHTSIPQHRDRLKPPPDAINFERKTIKLNSNSSKSRDLDNIRIKRMKKDGSLNSNGDVLDRIVIKDRRKEKEKTENVKNVDNTGTHKEESKETVDKSNSSGSDKKEIVARKIKLKRSHSTVSSEVSSSPAPSAEGEGKKQKSKICWP